MDKEGFVISEAARGQTGNRECELVGTAILSRSCGEFNERGSVDNMDA